MKPIDSTDTAATGALTPSVLPPLAFVQKALRLTTEPRARELAQPSPRAPDWSEHEWCIARAAASLHGISPLLAGCLRWHGPPGWRQFLEQQRTHTAARYAQIQTLLGQLESRSVASGVPFVALKGVALHRLGLYQPGDRPMADLDLLAAIADHLEGARLRACHRPAGRSLRRACRQCAQGGSARQDPGDPAAPRGRDHPAARPGGARGGSQCLSLARGPDDSPAAACIRSHRISGSADRAGARSRAAVLPYEPGGLGRGPAVRRAS